MKRLIKSENHRMKVAFCFALLSIFLISCSGNPTADRHATTANTNLEKKGSPYHWQPAKTANGMTFLQRELIGTPAKTSADAQLAADIGAIIAQKEAKVGGESTLRVLETRLVSATPKGTREIWSVARGDKRIAYVIYFVSSDKGGTDFGVDGPWE
jgi:outer membrane lipoprotein-sorting protein